MCGSLRWHHRLTRMMTTDLSPEATMAALVDLAFAEGRHEVERAKGRRGSLRLNIELVLGDGGVPLYSVNSLVFEVKRHAKDGMKG